MHMCVCPAHVLLLCHLSKLSEISAATVTAPLWTQMATLSCTTRILAHTSHLAHLTSRTPHTCSQAQGPGSLADRFRCWLALKNIHTFVLSVHTGVWRLIEHTQAQGRKNDLKIVSGGRGHILNIISLTHEYYSDCVILFR